VKTPKPTLVLLHGFLGNKQDWQPVIQKLGSQFNCLAVNIEVPDMLSEQSLSFARRCEHLFSRLDQDYAFPETFSLLGYSMGGRIALCWSHLFSHRITSLILESCHPGLTNNAERQQRLSEDSHWHQNFNSGSIENVLEQWYQQPLFSSLSDDQKHQLIQYRSSVIRRQDLLLLKHFSLGLQADYSILMLASRTHYICGQRDSKFQSIGQQLKSKNGAMHLYQFPESGHNVHLDCSDDYCELVSTLIN